MPRTARIKESTAIYHLISRSIMEFNLFPTDSDKDYFLDLLKENKERFNCSIYCYCLTTNCCHLIIDASGYDISKFMKALNQSYVSYINRKYNRRGHLLADRFNSKIINSDDYLLTVSAYIHNLAKDIPGYNGKEFEYSYSSMGIYLGKMKDKRNLVDTDFILGCVNEKDKALSQTAYENIVVEHRNIDINKKLKDYLEELQTEQFEYRSYREVAIRDKKPEEVIEMLADIYGIKGKEEIMHRWKRKTMPFRQVTAYILTTYCGMGIKETCHYMHNITPSCCYMLSQKGYEIVRQNEDIKSLVRGLSSNKR